MSTHAAPAEPIGLQVISAAQSVSGALDRALMAAGGSLRMWLILVAASGRDQRHGEHSEFSTATGVDALALSEDMHRMEVAGLVVRRTDSPNPREPGVELTDAGRALFHRLLRAVVAYDARLRTGFTFEEIDVFSSMLTRVRRSVTAEEPS
ncbi:MAG: MarR family winged helix-turn-helix transcriptional regulator [Candidatus Dormibacteria bacterium]